MSKDTRLRNLGYIRTRKLVDEALKSIGVIKSEHGVHSSCVGGATAAATAGVPDHAVKHQSLWK